MRESLRASSEAPWRLLPILTLFVLTLFSSLPSLSLPPISLKVLDHEGRNYRLFRDNLSHDIDPSLSKVIVKQNKVIIKIGKVKGEYSYDHWTDLTSKKGSKEKAKEKEDPQASIMNMMKDMYDDGDDNMKKIIGEAMEKSRRGEKMNNPGADDLGMGGLGSDL